MDAHPDTHRTTSELPLRGNRRRCGILGSPKRNEKRITLRVDLNASVLGKQGTELPTMLGQGIGVTGTEFLQKLRRTFDVRKQKRDGSRRKIPAHKHDDDPHRPPRQTEQASGRRG